MPITPWGNPDDQQDDPTQDGKISPSTLAMMGIKVNPAQAPPMGMRAPASRPQLAAPTGGDPMSMINYGANAAAAGSPGGFAMAKQGFDQANGSSSKNTNSESNKVQTKALIQSPVYNADQDALNMHAQAGAAVSAIPGLNEARANDNQLQNLLAMQTAYQKPQLDLKPMQEFADTWNHTNKAKDMAPVESAQDQSNNFMKQVQALAQSRKGTTQQLMEAMGMVKPSMETSMQDVTHGTTQAQTQTDTQSTKDTTAIEGGKKVPAPRGPTGPALLKDLDQSSEKELKPMRDSAQSAQHALSLLQQGGSVADTIAALQLVKSNVSRMTNFEFSKAGKGASDVSDKIDQAINNITTDKGFTPANRARYVQTLNAISDDLNSGAATLKKGRYDYGSTLHLNPLDMQKTVESHYTAVPRGYDGSTPAPKGATPAMTDMRRDWLQTYIKNHPDNQAGQ